MKLFSVTIFILFFLNLSSQTYINLDVHQSKDTIEANLNNPLFTILDVRTQNEYLPEHLEEAIYRDFYSSDFTQQLDSLNKKRCYLIYCRSGNRSGQTLQIMEELGFEKVYNMLGGMNSWNMANYPVTSVIPPYVNIYNTTTGILNSFSDSVSIYPNPFSEKITISIPKLLLTQFTIRIYSIDGSAIYACRHSKQDITIDLSSLDSGIYNIAILSNGSILTVKRIIKE